MAKKKEVTKQDIKDFAKELYFQVDSEGKRVHSLRDISNRILQKLNKKITHPTIKTWADTENWDALFLKVKQYGIEKAQITIEQKENEIIEKQGNIHADIQRGHKELYDLLQNDILESIKKYPTIRFEAKVKAFEIATNTLLKLNPREETKVDQSLQMFISSLDDDAKQKLIDKFGL